MNDPKVALSPMMCYTHPNGKSGMLEHNGIFCFESAEHTPMHLADGSIVTDSWNPTRVVVLGLGFYQSKQIML